MAPSTRKTTSSNNAPPQTSKEPTRKKARSSPVVVKGGGPRSVKAKRTSLRMPRIFLHAANTFLSCQTEAETVREEASKAEDTTTTDRGR